APPPASSRSLYAGSTHARATTFAPFIGPTSSAYASTTRSMNSRLTTPFSVSNSSSARARRSTSLRGRGWCPWSSLMSSDRLEVALGEVDVHEGIRLGRLAPELGGVEAHGVARVQHALTAMCLDLRDRRRRVDAHDDAPTTTHVTRAACVTGELNITHANVVAHGESRCLARRDCVDVAGTDGSRVRQREPAGAGVELRGGDRARLDEEGRDGREPVLVVPGRQVEARVHALDGVTEHRRAEPAGRYGTARDREGPRLPLPPERRFLRVDLDGAEALHAPEVVHPIHAGILASEGPRDAGTIDADYAPSAPFFRSGGVTGRGPL